MIVAPVHQPNFVGNTRGVWAKRVIVALHIDDALALLLFLADDVTENAALAILVPLVGRGQLIFNAPRHENGGGHFRMGVGPFVTSQRALILENAYVLKPGVFLEVGDTGGPNPENPVDFVVAKLRQLFVVLA